MVSLLYDSLYRNIGYIVFFISCYVISLSVIVSRFWSIESERKVGLTTILKILEGTIRPETSCTKKSHLLVWEQIEWQNYPKNRIYGWIMSNFVALLVIWMMYYCCVTSCNRCKLQSTIFSSWIFEISTTSCFLCMNIQKHLIAALTVDTIICSDHNRKIAVRSPNDYFCWKLRLQTVNMNHWIIEGILHSQNVLFLFNSW